MLASFPSVSVGTVMHLSASPSDKRESERETERERQRERERESECLY